MIGENRKSDHIIIVWGDSFHDASPRMRRLEAERTVEKVFGKKRPGLLARMRRWFTGA